MKLGELIVVTARRLASARLHYGHGTTNPRDEAAFLVLRGLGLGFDADLDATVGSKGLRRVESLVTRRIADRMPAAYLLKEAWLSGVPFHVDRRVIVPRSHIAALLDERLHPWLKRAPQRILDLCTGSGCLAVLAARAFPRAQVDAVDLSDAALAVAAANVARHGLRRRISLRRSDLFEALGGRRYGLILSNPPYVAEAAMSALPGEYRHEPRMALAGGAGGLDFVRRILAEAPKHLTPSGLLVCEVGGARRAVERAWPATEFLWPVDEVFILERARIPGPAESLARRQRATPRASARARR